MKAIKYILIILLSTATFSCKDYVEVENPRTELASGTIFVNDKTAIGAMVGIYSDMNAFNYYFANIVTMFLGSMNADDFTYASTSAEFTEFATNSVSPGNRYMLQIWSQAYEYIYRCNAIIEGLSASASLSPAVKDQLMAEAKFTRAFCYFYLVNIFGDVPLILDTDVLKNTGLPRTASAEVYNTLIEDLKSAKSLMNVNYPSTGERTRPTKGAATLLLARAYLYTGNNAQAEVEAAEVIGNTNYNLLLGADMNKSFNMNSREAVWQLQPVNNGGNRNTWEGFTLLPANMAAPSAFYRLTKGTYGLVDAFDAGDLRKTNWTRSYTTTATPPLTHTFPYKYKVRTGTPVTEYSMVMRFAEAYLIRAEARMQQNKLKPGAEDLDVIRSRAGFTTPLATPANTAAGMLLVEKERRLEFFAEWGHRWFDLKRWKSVSGDATKTRADDVLPATKTLWKSTAILMPIPTEARKTNSNLSQNLGYN